MITTIAVVVKSVRPCGRVPTVSHAPDSPLRGYPGSLIEPRTGRHNIAWRREPQEPVRPPNPPTPPRVLPQLQALPGVGAALGVERGRGCVRIRHLGLTPQAILCCPSGAFRIVSYGNGPKPWLPSE